MEQDFDHEGLRPLLNEVQAAPLLGLAVGTLRQERRRHRLGIPFLKIGTAVRYDPAELKRWIDEQRRVPRSVPVRRPRAGRPTRAEELEAAELGLTVPELRARKAGGER